MVQEEKDVCGGKEKLVVVVPITGEEISLQGCWVVGGHDLGEVVVAEKAKVVAVEEKKRKVGNLKTRVWCFSQK